MRKMVRIQILRKVSLWYNYLLSEKFKQIIIWLNNNMDRVWTLLLPLNDRLNLRLAEKER